METCINRKPRVLVLAYPELAGCVCEALERLGLAICIGSTSESRNCVPTLYSEIFPPLSPPRADGESGLPAFLGFGRGRAATAPQAISGGLDLFAWAYFDFVIVQDLWLKGNSDAHASESLVAAGYALSRLNYYRLGKFSTANIILVTDPHWIADELGSGNGSSGNPAQPLDEKGVLKAVRFPSADALGSLRRILLAWKHGLEVAAPSRHQTPPPWSNSDADCLERVFQRALNVRDRSAGHTRNDLRADGLDKAALHESAPALRRYIRERAEVVFVDDERDGLEQIVKEVTGHELQESRCIQGVYVTATSQQSRAVAKRDESGHRLTVLAQVCTEMHEAVPAEHRCVIFVTDILFKNWDTTGVDLIHELRIRLGHRAGIVAFTGFSTPFITMSAYQRGADFVVHKGAPSHHGPIAPGGVQNLLMTLAYLCFQKHFLRQKRWGCHAAASCNCSQDQTHAEYDLVMVADCALRELERVLPLHAVSPHVQQEWMDTRYYLEAAKVYPVGSPPLEAAWRMVKKYDS